MSLAAMSAILYVLASFGVAFVLGYSKITLPLRTRLDILANTPIDWEDVKLPYPPSPERDRITKAADRILGVFVRFPSRWFLALLECPACVAFWLGAASIFTPLIDAIPFSAPAYVLAPLLGFANLGAVLTLGLATNLIRTE
jgi:hypothetical protein